MASIIDRIKDLDNDPPANPANPPANPPADPPKEDPPKEEPKPPSNKDQNFAALRGKAEDLEKKLAEKQAEFEELRSKASLIEDEKTKKLLGVLEEEYDNDPEVFLTEVEGLKTKTKEYQEKLTEREKAIEKLRFEESEAYQLKVKKPITQAEERLKGVIKKDDALYKTLFKELVYDEKGQIRSGPLNADEIIKLDELLDEQGTNLKPERVEVAIAAIRETYETANTYYLNHKEEMAKDEEAKQLELAAQNTEQERLGKIARAREFKKASLDFSKDERLASIVGAEAVEEISKSVLRDTEDQIVTQRMPDVSTMYSNQIKSKIYDHLVNSGVLDAILESEAEKAKFSSGSVGTGSASNPPKSGQGGSVIDRLAEKAGISRRYT